MNTDITRVSNDDLNDDLKMLSFIPNFGTLVPSQPITKDQFYVMITKWCLDGVDVNRVVKATMQRRRTGGEHFELAVKTVNEDGLTVKDADTINEEYAARVEQLKCQRTTPQFDWIPKNSSGDTAELASTMSRETYAQQILNDDEKGVRQKGIEWADGILQALREEFRSHAEDQTYKNESSTDKQMRDHQRRTIESYKGLDWDVLRALVCSARQTSLRSASHSSLMWLIESVSQSGGDRRLASQSHLD